MFACLAALSFLVSDQSIASLHPSPEWALSEYHTATFMELLLERGFHALLSLAWQTTCYSAVCQRASC